MPESSGELTVEPRRGEFLRLGLEWVPDLVAPSLSPEFIAACLTGYTKQKLTRARTLELLRRVVAPDELPDVDALTLDDLRRSFAGRDPAECRSDCQELVQPCPMTGEGWQAFCAPGEACERLPHR